MDKVLFVVDRKDLDYQTMKEYDRFEKGSAIQNSVLRKERFRKINKVCNYFIVAVCPE